METKETKSKIKKRNAESVEIIDQRNSEIDQTKNTQDEHLNKRQRIEETFKETSIESNPYLAHLNKPVRPNQAISVLDGFIPGKTTAAKLEG